jgi:2-methylisocitrate lyase-like PEP mutase family enzyme
MEEGSVHPLIRDHRLVVVPGVFDVLSAKLARRAGLFCEIQWTIRWTLGVPFADLLGEQ